MRDTAAGRYQSRTLHLFVIYFTFLNPMHHILCLLISFCKPVPLFLFSSFVSHFPILRSILLPSPSYYHYLHSFFLSCSVLPRWLTVQTRRGKLGCSHNDRPFVLICSSSSSIKVSTQASNTHKQTHAHKHLQCLKLEETCFGPKPSKLITLPWWSGPVNLTRLQCWRETERIPFWEYLRSF